ncbi:DUF6470 family protein [Alkalihalophilus lindianensis]|uniref:DUF6470 family protein n=1 Tax=Alkalihalophilus lindianensis TaxID=1630542 RepID=A0ABU3X8R8_9BACI|nr:DUF6470 family protein [Alkalihalophilus lindianensis]MDV2684291.1 DUF6470 family protein [Alkalihalophilus lindianensis]
MRALHLDIQSTNAYVGLKSNRPHPHIKQHQADLQIRQTHTGIIEISTKASELFIDQTEAFADANLKTALRLANDFYSSSTAKVAEHMTKKRQEGDQMMKIENGFGAFARLAKSNTQSSPSQLHVVNMPRSMDQTKIHFQPSQISFNVPRHVADISINRREPDIQMPKWQTDTYLRQKNSISFQAVGASINRGL